MKEQRNPSAAGIPIAKDGTSKVTTILTACHVTGGMYGVLKLMVISLHVF
jgi:hypothetical protein